MATARNTGKDPAADEQTQQPATEDTGKLNRVSDRFSARAEHDDALNELDEARRKVAALEKDLGVTSTGAAHGGGLRGEVQALLRERAGYARRQDSGDEAECTKMTNRIRQVDEQLALRGYRVKGTSLQADTDEAFAAAAPGMLVEDAVAEREARQQTR